MTWNAHFSEPISLPDGRRLETLRDAGAFISRLPNAIYRTKQWRVATHLLIEAAEQTQPVELARFAVIFALEPPVQAASADEAERTESPMACS